MTVLGQVVVFRDGERMVMSSKCVGKITKRQRHISDRVQKGGKRNGSFGNHGGVKGNVTGGSKNKVITNGLAPRVKGNCGKARNR